MSYSNQSGYGRWEQARSAYQGTNNPMDFRDETGGFIDYRMDYPSAPPPTPTNVIASQVAQPAMPAMPVEPIIPPAPVMDVMPVTTMSTAPKTAGFGNIPTMVWLVLGGVALYYANQQGWLDNKLA